MRFFVALAFSCLICCANAFGQWSAEDTEVMVIGTPHLWQTPSDAFAKHTPWIQKRLKEFSPDMVAFEWLHPSIDPGKTDNYSQPGDAKTLAKLWGINRKKLPELREQTTEALAGQTGDSVANRILLGKLYYLEGDPLNAGYQWWLAARKGGDTTELGNLTSDNFAGHELEVFGFPAAEQAGLESVTAFDYQGADADWNNVFAELALTIARLAIPDDGTADDQTIQQKRQEFLEQMNSDPASWLRQYEENPRIRRYVLAVRTISEIRSSMEERAGNDPLGLLGHMQSASFSDGHQALYYEHLFQLPYGGLGRQLVVNYERRNEKMAGFVIDDARRQKASRILVIVGGGHKMFLDRIFRREGLQVIDSREFLMKGHSDP